MTASVRLRLLLSAVAAALAVAACGRDTAESTSASQPIAPSYLAVARGRVDVEGGELTLSIPVAATLTDVSAHEGEQVEKGQVLAIADATEARVQLEIAQAKLDASRRQQLVLQTRIDIARKRAERLATAAVAGAGDSQSADDARDATSLLTAERDAARSAEAIARAELEQARYLQDRLTLRAPVSAEVVHVSAQPGMSVSPQSPPLFTLLPRRPHIVRAELSQTFLSAVKIGMPAQLVSDDDSQTVSGMAHVIRISSLFGASTVEDESGTHVGERSVECDLAVDGASSLRVGQRVLVRFLAMPTATDQH